MKKKATTKKREAKKAAAPKTLRVFNWLSMQVARFCGESDRHYHLASVCFNGRKTVATDGRQLVVIDAPDVQDLPVSRKIRIRKHGPEVHSVAKALQKTSRRADSNDGQAFMLLAPTVRRLARDLKKRKRGEDHYCLVDSRKAMAKTQRKSVSCIIGQDDGLSISALHAVDGHYPNYNKVIPQEKPAVVIELNPEYMERICKLMKDVCAYGGGSHYPSMRLSVYGPDDSLKIEAKNEDTGQKALAVLMPIAPLEDPDEGKESGGKEGETK